MSPAPSPMRMVVLISGGGTNLQSFIDQCASGELPGEIAAVISNKANVGGLQRAERAGIATEVLDHKAFPNREAFDTELASLIDSYQPDLVILAGFMRILTADFVNHYSGRLLNIHPSLLPKYTGLHTHQRAIDAGDREAGASVHFVTAELDGGPVVLQGRVPVVDGDSSETLAARVLTIEHQIYPLAARWFAEGRLTMSEGGAFLDNQPIPHNGVAFPGAEQKGNSLL